MNLLKISLLESRTGGGGGGWSLSCVLILALNGCSYLHPIPPLRKWRECERRAGAEQRCGQTPGEFFDRTGSCLVWGPAHPGPAEGGLNERQRARRTRRDVVRPSDARVLRSRVRNNIWDTGTPSPPRPLRGEPKRRFPPPSPDRPHLTFRASLFDNPRGPDKEL